MENLDYIKLATAEAEKNLTSNEGGPFGAVIVKDNVIVGTGHNQVLLNNDPTCHAEIQAIRNACQNSGTYDLTDCILYTSCYPCPMCLSATIWANIKTIYYGNTAEDADKIGFRDDFMYQYLADKSINLLELKPLGRDITIKTFEKYQAKPDKKIYWECVNHALFSHCFVVLCHYSIFFIVFLHFMEEIGYFCRRKNYRLIHFLKNKPIFALDYKVLSLTTRLILILTLFICKL